MKSLSWGANCESDFRTGHAILRALFAPPSLSVHFQHNNVNGQQFLFRFNETCWDSASNIGSSGYNEATGEHEPPIFTDLGGSGQFQGADSSGPSSWFTTSADGDNYLTTIGVSSKGCDLGAGDYYLVLKASSAVGGFVEVQLKTKTAPSWMCNTNAAIIILIVFLVICCCCCVCIIIAAVFFGGAAACAACCKSNKHNSGGAGRYATNNPSAQQGYAQPGVQMQAYAPPQQGAVVQGTVQPAVVQGVVVQPQQPVVVQGKVV